MNAFGSDTEETDGGTFVDFYYPSDGAGAVPYIQAVGEFSDITIVEYSAIWFKNTGKSNYVHMVGAAYCDSTMDTTLGMCSWDDADNCQYTYLMAIQNNANLPDKTVAHQDVTAHETGHQFVQDSQTDGLHPDVLCHAGTDECVMDRDRDRCDALTEFCGPEGEGTPNHLNQVRDEPDGI